MRNTRLGRDVRRDLLAREEEKVFEALFAANQNGKLFFCRAVTRKPSPTFFLAPFENVAVSSPQQSQLGSNAGSNPFKCSHLILPKIDSRFFPTTKYLSQSPFFYLFPLPSLPHVAMRLFFPHQFVCTPDPETRNVFRPVSPDRAFHNSRASESVDRRFPTT